MEFVTAIFKDSTTDCWSDGLRWLGWALGGALLPIWTTMLILSIYSQEWDISVLYDQGEFALYAASFAASSLYIVTRDFNKRQFPNFSTLSLLFFLFLVASALIYAIVQSLVLVPSIASVVPLNKEILATFSWFVAPLVVLISMLVIVVENVRLGIDIGKVRKKNLKKLSDDFDDLGDAQDG